MTITIRATEPSDYEAMQEIFASLSVIAGTLQMPFPSKEMWRKRLADPRDGFHSLVACSEELLVGQLGLSTFPMRPRRQHVGQLSMAVREDWQGRGVGSALMQTAIDLAVNWLNLSRIELIVYTDNEPAIRLYQKFGFRIEGTLVQYAFRNGHYTDAYAMAWLKGE